MDHWIGMMERDPAELAGLVRLAQQIKAGDDATARNALSGKILMLVFFNPSLRTRASFESVMLRFGGHSITLSVGGDTWKLEHRDGAIMDGESSEHVREAAPVLGRYGDALGVRTFARLADAAEDASDPVIRAFAEYSTVPVVNMESALEHPCQGLADWMTIREKLGETRGRKLALTWAPHVRALPMAVGHSAVLAAAAAGMEVVIAHPPGYGLRPEVVERARAWCAAAGTRLTETQDQRGACGGADVVYVKSWGSAALYGKPDEQAASFAEHRGWTVGRQHLGARSILMHCLPVRRNLVISDDALDDPRCIVVDEAENRLWAQAAILTRLLG